MSSKIDTSLTMRDRQESRAESSQSNAQYVKDLKSSNSLKPPQKLFKEDADYTHRSTTTPKKNKKASKENRELTILKEKFKQNAANKSSPEQKKNKDTLNTSSFVNKTGYKKGAQTANNSFNIIPSGNITMKQVDTPVLAEPNLGKPVVMKPGSNYNFPKADYVVERKLNKDGSIPEITSQISQEVDSVSSLLENSKLDDQGPQIKLYDVMERYELAQTKYLQIKAQLPEKTKNKLEMKLEKMRKELDELRRKVTGSGVAGSVLRPEQSGEEGDGGGILGSLGDKLEQLTDLGMPLIPGKKDENDEGSESGGGTLKKLTGMGLPLIPGRKKRKKDDDQEQG